MDEMSIIAIACIVIVSGIILATFWYIASGLRRNISSAIATHIQELGLEEEDPSSLDSVGLHRQVIEALPVSQYKSHDGHQCSVCLSEYGDSEIVKLLPNCNHYFHKECIDKWFLSHSSCPVCRTTVHPNSSSRSLLDLEQDHGRDGSLPEQPISSGI
ncbi:hypothetical protein SUGI_0654150 [Cryptomeria japonica]|uniref:E3 ubiquitin-protein ligase RING1-like n=1 Tax=Cryptomeria japonica TaxID=3369 RepID=UPI002414B535|nr:E3 ubiquitin-protein ligase RING1-like [Cryptomeria japonica]GLJ32506.1 hypothetical protein SUGI_0654150 [Cryptomeria japonica]